jgi:lipoyl(octanoyl) transferase
MHRCLLLQPGLVSYDTGLVLQREARARVAEGRYDGILLLLEHPPVITIGRGGGDGNLVAHPAMLKARGIALARTDRGGNITGHNPGQLVGYPIFDLAKWRQDVHWFVDSLEEALIRTLARYGLNAGRKAQYTGVWLADDDRNLRQTGRSGQLHRGLPARRGRRRRLATRWRSSVSACAIRERSASSSVMPKYLGFNE